MSPRIGASELKCSSARSTCTPRTHSLPQQSMRFLCCHVCMSRRRVMPGRPRLADPPPSSPSEVSQQPKARWDPACPVLALSMQRVSFPPPRAFFEATSKPFFCWTRALRMGNIIELMSYKPTRMMDPPEASECPVCFEPYDMRIQCVLPCTHSVCMQCILKIEKPIRCPLCRMDLDSHIVYPPREVVEINILSSQHSNSIDIPSLVGLMMRLRHGVEDDEPALGDGSGALLPLPPLPPPPPPPPFRVIPSPLPPPLPRRHQGPLTRSQMRPPLPWRALPMRTPPTRRPPDARGRQ